MHFMQFWRRLCITDNWKDKVVGLGISKNFGKVTQLSDVSKSELQWWTDNVEQKNGKPIT